MKSTSVKSKDKGKPKKGAKNTKPEPVPEPEPEPVVEAPVVESTSSDINNNAALGDIADANQDGAKPAEEKPQFAIPLPPSMREVILNITDADLVRDKEIYCPQMIQCIAKHLRCKNKVPLGWIASNKYLLAEIVDWLIDEVDERVAKDRPFYVLTKRGKLKRDGLVLGKIHVYCTRIQQVAMEEALVTLLNSRLMRPRRFVYFCYIVNQLFTFTCLG